MQRVLVVEDDQDLRALLDYNLKQAGYDVLLAARGQEGLRLARERVPDLVVLDLMLPDLSGLEICKAIRADEALREVAVLMLTARGEEVDRIVGLELGADDYVVKPFSVRELVLRIQAILRRGGAEEAPVIVEFGILRFDRDAHRTWVDGGEVALTALEFRLLVTLHERRNRVQSRARLLDDVWAMSPELNTRTVDTHVMRLRDKLGKAGRYIETVRGVGYRFAGTPEE